MKNLFKKFFKHLVVIVILGYPIYHILHTFHVINPLLKELSDFKFTDIYFGHIQEKTIDNDIYLVDIGSKDNTITRSEISNFINYVNKKFRPKVIGIDVNFYNDTLVTDEVNDNLVNSLHNDNIVMGYDLINIKGEWLKNDSDLPLKYNIIQQGYTNNLVADGDIDFKVERFFQPNLIQGDSSLNHFSVVVAEKYQSDFDKSVFKNNKVMINFKYTFNDPISIRDTNSYHKLKDKIVVLGLFTRNKKGYPKYNEDLHYTSSNKFYLGKSPPNMYGGEVLATIISNINNNSFVLYYKSLSFWISLIFVVFIYLALLYFMQKSHNTYTAVTIITQFGIVFFFVFLSVFFVWKFNMYLDFTVLGVIAFFSVEFVEPIDKIIKLIENRFKGKKIENNI